MQILQVMEGHRVFDRCVVGFDRCNDKMPCASTTCISRSASV